MNKLGIKMNKCESDRQKIKTIFGKELLELARKRFAASCIKEKNQRIIAVDLADQAYYKKLYEWRSLDEKFRSDIPTQLVKVDTVTPKSQLIGGNYATNRYITTLSYERSKKRISKQVEGFISGKYKM